MKFTKKIIAAVMVLAIALTLAFGASAGSLKDTIKNAITTYANATTLVSKMAGQTVKHAVTDLDIVAVIDESSKEIVQTTKDIEKTSQSAKQVVKDAEDVRDGILEVAVGTAELIKSGSADQIANYVTGDGPVDPKAKEALDKMKAGYKKMDNDLILDAISLVPGGHYVAAGINTVKTAVEYGVGYISAEEAEEKMKDQAISTGFHILTGGINEYVPDAGSKFLIGKISGAVADIVKKII